MQILFLHGWNSVVGGVKPTYLKDHGHEVVNPKLPDEDFNWPSMSPSRSSTSTCRMRSSARHEAAQWQ
jgi:hypothetical protein